MGHIYKNCLELGLHWIFAFTVLATLTVSLCLKEEAKLLASSHTIIAMK